MSRRDNSRVIFANMVNELMVAVAPPAHAKALTEVSPRKLWLAQEGDVVVTPRPIDEPFKRYACAILGIDPDEVVTLSPAGELTETLAHALRRRGMVDRLRAFIAERPNIEFLAFALDSPTLELVEDLGVPLHGYRSLPNRALREMIYQLNTKSGFRRAAENLGLRIVPGAYCEGLDALASTVEQMLGVTGGVIVKYDRSSNGYGHIIFRREEVAGRNLCDYLAERTAAFPEQPHIFTIEALMPFDSVPSVEMVIDDAGARLLYLCDQRCPNGAFAGIVTPPLNLAPKVTRELLRVGELFGDYVHGLGFREVCDVDAGVTVDGTLYVTETNFRRTGGTYLDALMRRLIGDDYLDTHVWWADARVGGIEQDFCAGWSAIEAAGLAFDSAAGEGVILTADSLRIDGKWRYLIIAPTAQLAADMEAKLEKVLQLPKGV